MDNLLLEFWVNETRAKLLGRRLCGMIVDEAQGVRFDFGRGGGELLAQLKPGRVLCYWSPQTSRFLPESLPTVSTCNTLTDLVRNSRISQFDKRVGERIIQLHLDSTNGKFVLLLELLPSAPNVFLLDLAGKILGCLHRESSLKRGLQEGSSYTQPPDNRLPLQQALACSPPRGMSLAQWLVLHVSGMSRPWTIELVERCGGNSDGLEKALDDLLHEPCAPCLCSRVDLESLDWRTFDPWQDVLVSPVRLRSQHFTTVKEYPYLNTALSHFAALAEESRHFLTLRKTALATARAQLARQERLVAAVEQECRHMANPERFRILGELLLANLESLKKQLASGGLACSKSEVFVNNYYNPDEQPLGITINPRKSLQANAEDYFKAYRKAKRGLQLQTSRLTLHRQALDASQALKQQLETASNLLALKPHIKSKPTKPPPARITSRRSRAASHPRCRIFISSDGFEIWVGRSAAQNEELTFKHARAGDLWLHVADYSGCHVIVRNPSRKGVPRKTLQEAAQLAAYFSTARSETRVAVRYTEQKYVHKVKGAAPGQVRLQSSKTLWVAPKRSFAPAAKLPLSGISF